MKIYIVLMEIVQGNFIDILRTKFRANLKLPKLSSKNSGKLLKKI